MPNRELLTHAIMIDGELTRHIASGEFGYVTLCGLDGDDSDSDQAPVIKASLHRGLITCGHCRKLWLACSKVKNKHFAPGLDD